MTNAASVVPRVNRKRKPFLRQLHDYRYLLAMLLPAIAFFLVFYYAPMYGLVISFKRYDYALGILHSPWNGLDNFQFLFRSGKLYTLLANTVLYNTAFIVVGMMFQIAVSILLSEMNGRYFKKACQTALFLPYFISWVAVSAVVYNLLSYRYGFVNGILNSMGVKPINFYAKASYWPMILLIANTWKGLGYGTVVYMAAIAGIDAEIYEAAQIDGASVLQRIWNITLPNLISTMVTLLLLNIGGIFRGNFQLFWSLVGSNNLLYKTTDVIDTYVYRSLLTGSNFGMTSAAGLIQSVLCFAIILAVNAFVKRISPDNALF